MNNGKNGRENDKEPCIIVIDYINTKKHCLLNCNKVLFYFSPFLACEKHSVRKGFSKLLKKGLNFAVFILRFLNIEYFRGLCFCEITQKSQNRENLHTQKLLHLT